MVGGLPGWNVAFIGCPSQSSPDWTHSHGRWQRRGRRRHKYCLRRRKPIGVHCIHRRSSILEKLGFRGWEKTSDHAPVLIELKNAKARPYATFKTLLPR